MTLERIATSDFKGLNELKVLAKQDQKQALPEVARQFEGIFLQSMLKSMRTGQHFLEESSPFRGKNLDTFQEMLDGQLVGSISKGNGVGLAKMLAQQLQSSLTAKAPEMVNTVSVRPSVVQGLPEEETSPKAAVSSTIDEFVKSIWPIAKKAASQLGLDPKILMAQAALETGWGKFVAKDADGASSFNLFNIKAGTNQKDESVNVKTTEYIAGTPLKMNASFRKYASVEHSFSDYVSLITGSSRYQTAVANAANPERYMNELSKAGYATDPHYASKILSIYHGDELKQAIQRCELSDAF